MHKIPRLLRFMLVTTLIEVVFLSLLRIVFWKYFGNPNDPLPGSMVMHSLYIGFKFDLRLVLLSMLPILLLGWIGFLSPFTSRFGRWLWSVYLTVVAFVIFLYYIFDFGWYAYLHVRMDASILRFLGNPETSASMVWESYPVVWIVLGLLALTALYAWGIRRLIAFCAGQPTPSLRRWQKAIIAPVSFILVVFGIYGQWAWYPLRWSNAFYSTNQFASEMALNPVLYSYDSYLNGGIKYDIKQVRAHYDQVAHYLGVKHPDKQSLNFIRHPKTANLVTTRPNVVLVFLESFAAYKTGEFGNPLDPTPNFDKLCENGLLFSNYWVPATGTARSVFAAITGLPDVQMHDTSSTNPQIVNQHTVINAFKGYQKYYFIGASANWRNIGALLSNNIPGIDIREEEDYTSPRNDVWGISDIDLFREANKVFRKQQKPFFAIIQTAGNHRPYTIPKNDYGFKLAHHPEGMYKKYGFDSEKEFNSFRFMDHSIGHFIAQAKKEKYFNNTIFVFFGDHGISGNAGLHRPKSETELQLGSWHVPFLIYAPHLIKPQVNSTLVSELDMMPTMASLTGHPYTDTTLGRDMLDPQYKDRRDAFIINWGSAMPTIGLLSHEYYFTMYPDGSNKQLHARFGDDPRKNLADQHPDLITKMSGLTRGIYESTKYIMNHNSREHAGDVTTLTAKNEKEH